MPAHADPAHISDHVQTEGHDLDASELRGQLLNVVKHSFYARTVFGRLQGYWKLGWMVRMNIRARGVDRISVQWAPCPIEAVFRGPWCSSKTHLLRILVYNHIPRDKLKQFTETIGCTLGDCHLVLVEQQ